MTLMQSTTMVDLSFHFVFLVKLCLSGLSPGAKFSTNLKARVKFLSLHNRITSQSESTSFPDANERTKSLQSTDRPTDQKYISFRAGVLKVYKWHLL